MRDGSGNLAASQQIAANSPTAPLGRHAQNGKLRFPEAAG